MGTGTRRVVAFVSVVSLATVGSVFAWGPLPAGSAQSSDQPPSTFAETLIGKLVGEAWNEDPALVALRARDQGYDLAQTVEGISKEELAADGTITEDGEPVTPADPAPGVLAREGEDAVTASLETNEKTLTKPKSVKPPEEVLDGGAFMVVILLGLMAKGYTMEQIIVDGILAKGIDVPCPFCGVDIVDEKGRVVKPGEQGDEKSADDALVEGVIGDMVAIVEGANPQDPDFKATYDVTYTAKSTSGGGAPTTVTAKGRLGPAHDADNILLGRMKGTVKSEAGECPAETVKVIITFFGQALGNGRTLLRPSYAYVSSKTGPPPDEDDGAPGVLEFETFCFTAAEDPAVVALFNTAFGSLIGKVEPGRTLRSVGEFGEAELTIKDR